MYFLHQMSLGDEGWASLLGGNLEVVKNCKSEGPLMIGLSVLHLQMTSAGWVASVLDHFKDDVFSETCMLEKMDPKEFDIMLGIHDLETMTNESVTC